MDLVLEKKELSKRVNVVKNYKINIEKTNRNMDNRVSEILKEHTYPNVLRAKKALDSCVLYSQKLVAVRYGSLAIDMDFEKIRPSKKQDIVEWEIQKQYMKELFHLFIDEGGFEV